MRRVRHLSPQEASEIVFTYLRESAPDVRQKFLKMIKPTVEEYENKDLLNVK